MSTDFQSVIAGIIQAGGDTPLDLLLALPRPTRVFVHDELSLVATYDRDTYVCTVDPSDGRFVFIGISPGIVSSCNAKELANGLEVSAHQLTSIGPMTTVLFETVELARHAVAVDNNGQTVQASHHTVSLRGKHSFKTMRERTLFQTFVDRNAPVLRMSDQYDVCAMGPRRGCHGASLWTTVVGSVGMLMLLGLFIKSRLVVKGVEKRKKKKKKKQLQPPSPPTTITSNVVRCSVASTELANLFEATRAVTDMQLLSKMETRGWFNLKDITKLASFQVSDKELLVIAKGHPELFETNQTHIRPRAWRLLAAAQQSK